MEVWKPVPGHGGCFVASSEGRIARVVGSMGANGYQQICFKRSMKPYKAGSAGRKWPEQSRGYAHHLVALAFIGEPPEGRPFVNHKDLNRSNNRPGNLEWCSQRENLAHFRQMRPGQREGKLRPWKYTLEIWQQVRTLYEGGGWSYRKLAKHLGITAGAVRWILKSPRYREAA